MKIGFVQFNPVFGDVDGNVRKAIQLMDSLDAELIVLPELAFTGYLFEDLTELEALAEPVPKGKTFRAIQDFSKSSGKAVIYGAPEEVRGVVFNSAVAVLPDGRFFIYRKSHLFDREKMLFKPGDTGFFVFEFRDARIGMIVCYDWVFPEAVRSLALAGAQIVAHPANLVLPYAQRAMRVRSIENRIFTITANRIGIESRAGTELRFTGKSQITSPDGSVLASASEDAEAVMSVEIDPAEALNKKFTELTDIFEDRRPELYKNIVGKF